MWRDPSFELPFELPFDLPWGLEPRQVVLGLVGAVLLLFGRRLYWLALGAVGFGAGLWFFEAVRPGFHDLTIRLLLALLLGLAGALAAVFLQKLAVSVIGFFAGLMAVLWLTEPWRSELGGNLWWLALGGAVLGTLFSSALFEAGLIVATSVLGAVLVSDAARLELPRAVEETWLFLGLVAVGLVVQTTSGRRRRRRRRRLEDAED